MAKAVMLRSAAIEEPEQLSETVLARAEASLVYARWRERGSPEFSPDQDWFSTEQDLKKSSAAPA